MMNDTNALIIGDVHGCFDELIMLVEKARRIKADLKIYMLGDLINKGPESFKVLKWVRENKIPSVIGNHELKFIEGCRNNLELSAPLAELKRQMADDLEDWLEWMDRLPSYIETEDFILVHGGLEPNKPISESSRKVLANIRYWDQSTNSISKDPIHPAWHDLYFGRKLVVYGHWAKQGLKVKDNSIGLDSGLVYGKKLTGLLLPSRTLIQVDAIRVYKRID